MSQHTPRRPWRCNYCQAPAVVWARYQGYISRSIRPRTGGPMVCYMAACATHEGCPNWTSMLGLHPEARIERKETTTHA
jgi:hypothetical protein